ncbi:hypothetical protein D1872_51540 [compost metagenome]
MFRSLMKIILAWGKHTTDKYDDKGTYVPQYGGKWVNKSKSRYGEIWEWKEDRRVTHIKKFWVNVFKQGKDSYMIVVAHDSSEFAVEYLDCETPRDAARAIRMYNAYYKVLGKVQIDDSLLYEYEGANRA